MITTITYASWTFPPEQGWAEHAALMITFSSGEVYYFDNGALGGRDRIFTDEDIPRLWRTSGDHGQSLDEELPFTITSPTENMMQTFRNLFGLDE